MPKRIALIIANNAYQDNRLARLAPPPVDPPALAAILRDPTIGNFDAADLLINRPVPETLHRLEQLFQQRRRHDLLLLYFAGLAVLDPAGQLYLAAADTSVQALAETAIPAAVVAGHMDRCFSRQQIFILDCYHTCPPTPGLADPVGSVVGTAAAFRGSGHGRAILTAADTIRCLLNAPHPPAADPVEATFTHHLILGLRTGAADRDDDGQIDTAELYDHIAAQLNLRSTARPRHWTYQAQDKFILARNPKKADLRSAIKWDLIFGAIFAPAATIFIGARADLTTSIGMAGLLLLLYAVLYHVLE